MKREILYAFDDLGIYDETYTLEQLKDDPYFDGEVRMVAEVKFLDDYAEINYQDKLHSFTDEEQDDLIEEHEFSVRVKHRDEKKRILDKLECLSHCYDDIPWTARTTVYHTFDDQYGSIEVIVKEVRIDEEIE